MKLKTGVIIGLVIVSAGILVLLFLLNNPGSSAEKRPKDTKEYIVRKKNDWTKRYGHQSIEPYGTYTFFQLLKKVNRQKTRVMSRSTQYDWMDTIRYGGKMYMYVGASFPKNTKHLRRILNMVKRGNSAFIASEVFPARIMHMLNRTHRIRSDYDTVHRSEFLHPAFQRGNKTRFFYIFKNQRISHYWAHFYAHRPVIHRICLPGHADTVIKGVWIAEGKYVGHDSGSESYEEEDEDGYTEAGSDENYDEEYDDTEAELDEVAPDKTTEADEEFTWNADMRKNMSDIEWNNLKRLYNDTVDVYSEKGFNRLDYFSFRFGKGRIYIHTNPYAFTNVVLKTRAGFNHAENVINCFKESDIYFDSYLASQKSRQFYYGSSGDGSEAGGSGGEKRQSPLQFILKNPSFRWAWYILLFSLLLYIVFRGKRRQQVLQPVEPVSNDHLEFSDTVSKLYLNRGEPKHIVRQLDRNLQFYVRRKYYINMGRKPTEADIIQVVRKSGINEETVRDIYERFRKVRVNNVVSMAEVTYIYNQLEYFYKNCR